MILEKEIPGDTAFVAPLTVRTVDFLVRRGLIEEDSRERMQLCLTEALRNAVLHGNRGEFSKRVVLRVFTTSKEWGMLIEDEGDGFDWEAVPDPLESEGVWGESGRGLRILRHYMDRVEHYAGGTAVLLTASRK
ncbi:MAG: ATP-binding protein [Planctomycetota bacterium]